MNTKSKRLSSSKDNYKLQLSDLFGKKVPKFVPQLEKAGIKSVEDLMWIFPYRFERIPKLSSYENAIVGTKFIGHGKIYHREKKFSKMRSRFKGGALSNLTLRTFDAIKESTNTIELTFFNLYPSQFNKLNDAQHITFYGEVGVFNGKKQIVNPEVLFLDPDEFQLNQLQQRDETIRPVYPTINKVKPEEIKRTLDLIPNEKWDDIIDIVPQNILEKNGFYKLSSALKIMHGHSELGDKEKAKESLIYHEFFVEQSKLLVRKSIIRSKEIIPLKIPDDVKQKSTKLFGFEMTSDQLNTLNEIYNDLSKNYSMMRLVQGDVGTGKTAVAIAAGYSLARIGQQTAFMCPTESLAQQHFQTFSSTLEPLGIKCALITSNIKPKSRKEIIASVLKGDISVVIGTHALITDDVQFKMLALTIIDEQHKFGVEQRLKLTSKSHTEHCLIMTATPIPRSLALSQYGDLDVSIIKTLPSNRKGVKSRIVTAETFSQFLNFMKTRISMGEQAFIVVPAIEESETMDMTNLQDSLKQFKGYFPEMNIEALHGRMKADEKNYIVQKFSSNEVNIIVATSVVEVGINIPNASVMAVLNPERFGLSSLHQLRGRVGRGDKPGFFFLVLDKKVSQEALTRLRVIESTTDGFQIAEEDLKIRGEGDLLGRAQSGLDNTKRIADLARDSEVLELARSDVDNLFLKNKEFTEFVCHYFENDPLVRLTI